MPGAADETGVARQGRSPEAKGDRAATNRKPERCPHPQRRPRRAVSRMGR